MTFDDRAAYQGFMAGNPAVAETLALGTDVAADLRAYLDHDAVVGSDGRPRSSCVLDAIRIDGGAVVLEPEVLDAVRELAVGGTLLWAPRGLMNQTPGSTRPRCSLRPACPRSSRWSRSPTATTTRSSSPTPAGPPSGPRCAIPGKPLNLFNGLPEVSARRVGDAARY
jgi:hypothetical protein